MPGRDKICSLYITSIEKYNLLICSDRTKNPVVFILSRQIRKLHEVFTSEYIVFARALLEHFILSLVRYGEILRSRNVK
jgi:hypothetical protein